VPRSSRPACRMADIGVGVQFSSRRVSSIARAGRDGPLVRPLRLPQRDCGGSHRGHEVVCRRKVMPLEDRPPPDVGSYIRAHASGLLRHTAVKEVRPPAILAARSAALASCWSETPDPFEIVCSGTVGRGLIVERAARYCFPLRGR
jgi:hypothetical protein